MTPPGTIPLLAHVEAALPRHAFWESPVVVGVSGGADSTALLLGLTVLARGRAGATLVVAHAEHDLRPEAAGDRDFVAALAERCGVRFETRRVAVLGDGAGGEGIEARARRLRYGFFEDVARDVGGRHVAVAHTADDQAETILHRILRGTGLAGLAGMPRVRRLCDGVALVRPLLGLRRSAVRGWLDALGEHWREDASNADTRHARNFLRHEILPRAESGPYPAGAASLVRLGARAATLSAALASAAEHLLDAHAVRQTDGTITIDPVPLGTLDRHLVTEVFATLWRREGWPRRDMAARHYERLADTLQALAARRPAPRHDLPGGIEATATPAGRLQVRCRRAAQEPISTRR